MSRVLSCVLSIFLATALSACGGGGNSSPSASSGAESSSTSQNSLTTAVTTQNSSILSADGLTISPGYLDLLALTNSNVYQQQTLSIQGSYVGDGVLIGYAPGVQPASWLTFSQTTQSAGQDHQFTLPITLLPGSMSEGFYQTTLRFASGYTSGGVTGIVDLPVYLNITAAPAVYVSDVTLGGFLGKLTSLSRTIPLDFNGMVPEQVSATLRSDMGSADQWLSVAGDWQTSLLTMHVNPGLKVGTYSGFIDVAYTIQGAQGSKAIPFKIIVQADAPDVERVAPSYMYSQGTNVLVIRGHAFSKATTVSVNIGTQAADVATIVSDSEIRATFNGGAAVGTYAVQVVLDGKTTSPGDVAVIAQPVYTMQDVLPPCSADSGNIVFDPSRGNIIGFCDDTYYVMGQRGGAWSVLATRKVDGIDYAGAFRSQHLLTADQKYVIVVANAQLLLLDPVTLQTLDTRAIPVIWPDSAGYGALSLEAALNNGKIVLTISGVGSTYFVYDLDAQTLIHTQQISAHIVNARASAALRSTLQLVYVKSANQQSATSSDPEIFTVTLLAAPDSWMADYALPPLSPDGQKVAMYTSGLYNELFNLYDTTTITQLGTVANARSYNAPVLRFTESGNALFIVDGGQGRVDIYGANVNDTSLKHSSTFQPYSYYAGLSNFDITPDQGAVILYGASNGNGTGSLPPLKIIPVSR